MATATTSSRSTRPRSRSRGEAFGGRDGYVIGDVGPFGGLLEPYGDFTETQVRDAFNEQAQALVDAGADAIIIETQTSLEELTLGIRAAKQAGAPCVIGSMAYDVTLDGSTFRTMMGIDPEQAAELMEELGADVVALNCGTGMDMVRAREAVERYRSVTDLPVMAQPNAGLPKLIQMKVVYDETPEDMVARRRAAARGRRQHRRRLLRQHARPHPRISRGDRRVRQPIWLEVERRGQELTDSVAVPPRLCRTALVLEQT